MAARKTSATMLIAAKKKAVSKVAPPWIERAKRPETRQKRLDQMLDELLRGDVYMRMAWG